MLKSLINHLKTLVWVDVTAHLFQEYPNGVERVDHLRFWMVLLIKKNFSEIPLEPGDYQ